MDLHCRTIHGIMLILFRPPAPRRRPMLLRCSIVQQTSSDRRPATALCLSLHEETLLRSFPPLQSCGCSALSPAGSAEVGRARSTSFRCSPWSSVRSPAPEACGSSQSSCTPPFATFCLRCRSFLHCSYSCSDALPASLFLSQSRRPPLHSAGNPKPV